MKNVVLFGIVWYCYEYLVVIKMLLLIIYFLLKVEKLMMKILYFMKNDKSYEVFDFGMFR